MSLNCNHINSKCIDVVPIFNSLTPQEKQEVYKVSQHKVLSKGQFAYMAGDSLQKLYIIHTGKIKVYRTSDDGKEQVIRILGSGEFIGELSLFSSQQAYDYAQAQQQTAVCILDAKDLKQFMAKKPEIAFKLLEVLSARLSVAEQLIKQINLDTAEKRLASALVKLAGNTNIASLNTTKGNLASQLGMSQETLSRKLTLFQENGWVELLGPKKIKLLDKNKLENL